MENNSVNSAEDTQIPQTVKTYKMIPFRGKVVFPGQTVNCDFVRDKAQTALDMAYESGEPVFLVAQKRATMVRPAPQDIYRVGVLATIKNFQRLPGDALRVVFTEIGRAHV